jgi:hypothetical protein
MRKYISLIVCVVLLVIAMVMGRPESSNVTIGAGNGKPETIATAEEFVDVLDFFESFEFKTSSSAEAGGVTGFATKQDSSEKYTSATFYNKSKGTVNMSQGGYGANSTFSRELTIYLTETAAYYKSVGVVMTKSTSEEYKTSLRLNFDFEMYITTNLCLVKFERFDIGATGEGTEDVPTDLFKPSMMRKWISSEELGEIFMYVNQENYALLGEIGDYFEDYKFTKFTKNGDVYKINEEFFGDAMDIIFGDIPAPEDIKGNFVVDLSAKTNPRIKMTMSYSDIFSEISMSAYEENYISFSNINNTVIKFNVDAKNIYHLDDFGINEGDFN